MHGDILNIRIQEWPMILEANVSIEDFPQHGVWCYLFQISRVYLFSQHLEMTREHATDWIKFFFFFLMFIIKFCKNAGSEI